MPLESTGPKRVSPSRGCSSNSPDANSSRGSSNIMTLFIDLTLFLFIKCQLHIRCLLVGSFFFSILDKQRFIQAAWRRERNKTRLKHQIICSRRWKARKQLFSGHQACQPFVVKPHFCHAPPARSRAFIGDWNAFLVEEN